MSQTAIIELLTSNPGKWFVIREISQRIGVNYQSTSRNIKGLKRINKIEINKEYKRPDDNRYCCVAIRYRGDKK